MFNSSASGYKYINNFFTSEILPFGSSNIGNVDNYFENGYFNNLNITTNSSTNLRFTSATGTNLIITTNSSTNLRFTSATGTNLIITNTINSNTISTGNFFSSNLISTNVSSSNSTITNLLSTNHSTNNSTITNLRINTKIELGTSNSINQIPIFIEPTSDQAFLAISAGGGGSLGVKRSGIIIGRQRTDLPSYRIENNSNGNLQIFHQVGSSQQLYYNTSGTNIFDLNSSRLSTGNIQNINTTLNNLISTSITSQNIDMTRGGVDLLFANFQTVNNLRVNNTINSFTVSTGNLLANNAQINNSTISNQISTNISVNNISVSNLISLNSAFTNQSGSNATINSLRFNNINAPIIYSSGNLGLNIDNTSLKLDEGILEVGDIGTYLRGVKGVQALNASLMLGEVNDLLGFSFYSNVDDFTETLGVRPDAVFLNIKINEDHFKFEDGFPFSYLPPFALALKLPNANQICFIRDGKITGDNSLKFDQASQGCTIENLEGEHIDFRDANFTYITSGNIRSTNLLYGPNLYVNNLHSCANATMTNLKVNNVLTADSFQADLISTTNLLLVNITTSNIKANNKITSDVFESNLISSGSILTNHITTSNLRVNSNCSINNLQCEVAFIGGMSAGNITCNNLRVINGFTCESLRANDTIASLCLSSANLYNQTSTLGNIYFDNINQNPFGYATFSNMRILNTLGSNAISCANLWVDGTVSSRALSLANFFSINGTMDNLKINSFGNIGLISSGTILNDNTISSLTISCSNFFNQTATLGNVYFDNINQNAFGHCTFSNMRVLNTISSNIISSSNLWVDSVANLKLISCGSLFTDNTLSSTSISTNNIFGINSTMSNLRINNTLSSVLISCGSLFTDNTLNSTAISTNNIFSNNITLGSLRINNQATIDNLLATNITITNAVPRITLRDTQASTDNEVVCRGYLKDLNSWMTGELGSNMQLSGGKLKCDLQAVPFGGITITDDKNIRIDTLKMTTWDGYNARIASCEAGVVASGALITFLNTAPVPNALFVGAPQYFIFVNTSLAANAVATSTALGVGSDALSKVNDILAGTRDLSIPTLNSININCTNLSAENFSTSNVILNGTSLNSIITNTNTSINNINSSISLLSFPTAPSNFIATTLTSTNIQLNTSSLNTIILSTNTSINNINSSISSLSFPTAPSNFFPTNISVNNLRVAGDSVIGAWLYYNITSGSGFKITPNFAGGGELQFHSSGHLFTQELRTSNLTTTNIQLNGSSLNTILTNTFNSINNLSALTSANLSNISSSNICTGTLVNTNQTVLNNLIVNGNVGIGTNNTAGVNLNVNNPGGTCRIRASGPYANQQGFGLFDTTNNSESWSIIREGNTDNLLIYRNSATITFNMDASGNLGLRGNVSCANLRSTNSITTQNLVISNGATTLEFTPGFRGGSSVGSWTTIDPNPGGGGLFIWDGFEVSGPITCSSLQTTNLNTTSLTTTNLRILNGITSQSLNLRGTSTNYSLGPHVNVFRDSVSQQMYQQLNWNNDNIALSFDGYYDSNWKRSSSFSGYQLYKINDTLQFNYVGTGGVGGDNISWLNSFVINSSGVVSGGNFQLNNSILNNSTINNLMIPSGTNSSITLANSFIKSTISAGTASTYRHFRQSRLVQKSSASIGSLDIEEAEILALDPNGTNDTCFLPNQLTNIPLNYSGEFIIRHNNDSFQITLSTIANGSFIYPANQQQILTARQFARIFFTKTGNTTATYYINKSTS